MTLAAISSANAKQHRHRHHRRPLVVVVVMTAFQIVFVSNFPLGV
jgi:hypothetical protein